MRRSTREQQPVAEEPRAGPDGDADRGRARVEPRDVDEVEREEPVEDVEKQVGGLERRQPAQHLGAAAARRATSGCWPRAPAAPTGAICGARRAATASGTATTASPARAARQPKPSQSAAEMQQRAADVAERARERPARHAPLALAGEHVHQGRLREADEGAARRVGDDERDEQRREAGSTCGDRGRAREDRSPSHEHGAPEARVAGGTDQRVEHATDEPGDREQQTHLRVAEREVVPDQRPRRPDRPVDELVEELDREQQDDGAAKAATPGGLAGCASHDRPNATRAGRRASVSRTSSR